MAIRVGFWYVAVGAATATLPLYERPSLKRQPGSGMSGLPYWQSFVRAAVSDDLV
ncbi:MAG: hypothetical protein M3076_12270 [Actinomycetota bacterium]|nr:hypothetical protein [Actinomycetota bacterium]